MKKFKLTKVIASSLIVASVLALNPISANAEWKQDNVGWWYTEGSSWSTGWRLVDGKWYYFNADGYMAHDTKIDGYQVNSDGAWIQEIILATIGDEEITKSDFDKKMSKYDSQLKKVYGDDYATNDKVKAEITKIKKQQLDNMVIEKILLKKGTELNLKQSDDVINKEIDDTIKQYKTQYSAQGQFESLLKESNITEDQLREVIKTSIITNAVEKYMVKDITVTDDQIKKYYDENKNTKFSVDAGANVSHILVEDEKTAKDLKAKLDAGADFATLAKENSIDPGSKNKGGSLGFVPYNSKELIAVFMDGFKNLKEGEVSAPIKSEYGYHLIKVQGLKSSGAMAFDEVKDEIKSILLQPQQESTYNSKLSEWKTTLKVKTYEDKL